MSHRSSLTIIGVFVLVCMRSAIFAMDPHSLAIKGGELSPEEAELLEKQVEQNPSDVDSRTTLLGYYFGVGRRNKPARQAKRKHILWLILNSPESEVLSLPYGQLDPYTDADAYAQCKKAWLDHIMSQPDNLKILGNSARFFVLHDRELALESLKKAQSLDSNNPEWARELGQLYSLDIITRASKGKVEAAEKALEQLELAYELSTDAGQDALLKYLAKVALVAGRSEKAKEYAEKMLSQNSPGWNYGNNVHHGNLILGRIALASDDVEEAKARLIAAGETPGSPQLDSFGPGMTLAKELLERGEIDVVLRYFDLCSKFWEGERGRLDKWSAAVKEGKVPDLRSNLRY